MVDLESFESRAESIDWPRTRCGCVRIAQFTLSQSEDLRCSPTARSSVATFLRPQPGDTRKSSDDGTPSKGDGKS